MKNLTTGRDQDNNDVVIRSNGIIICRVEELQLSESEQLAKLFAAAPDMLEALRELVKLHPYAKGMDKAQQAINKATQL